MRHAEQLYCRIKSNKTLVNGSLYSLFSFFGRGMSFILLIILAKYIPPADYGRLSLFSTVETFLTYFMALSTSGYLSISFFRKETNEFRADFSSVILLGCLSLVVYSLILLAAPHQLSKILNLDISVLWCAVVIPFTGMLYSILLNLFRIKENLKGYGLLSCSNALFNFFFSLLFVITFYQGWLGRIETQLICSILYALFAIWYFEKSDLLSFNISFQRLRSLISWGLPMIPHLGAIWIRRGLDQYIINYNYSVYEVGLFSFALNIVGVIIMIGSAFNDTNSVSIYKILSDKNRQNSEKRKALHTQTRNIFLIYLIATITIVGLIPPAVYIFLPQYIPALPYFFILSVYGFVQCIYFLVCNYLFYYGKTRQLMYITFGTSILHLVLSLLLTQYSLYFTATVYIVVQLIIVVLTGTMSNKQIHNNLS